MISTLLLAACATLGEVDLTLLGSTYSGGEYLRAAAGGGYAYYPSRSGVTVFDVSDPSMPTPVGEYPTEGHTYDVVLQGDVLYVGTSGGLLLLDVKIPKNPTLLGSASVYASWVAVSGQYAYVAAGTSIMIMDVSDPAAPERKEYYNCRSNVKEIVAVKGHAYASLENTDVVAVNVSDPVAPTETARIKDAGAYGIMNHYKFFPKLYVATNTGLQYINIVNPASAFNMYPVLRGDGSGTPVLTGSDLRSVAVSNGRVYVKREKSIVVFEDQLHEQLGEVTAEEGTTLTVADGVAYTGNLQIELLDVSDPASMASLGTWSPPFKGATDVAVTTGIAYAAFLSDYDTGLYVYDVAGTTPVLRSRYSAVSGCTALALDGSTLYLAHSNGVVVLDMSNIPAPALLNSFASEQPKDIAVSDSYLYSVLEGTLNIYDMSAAAPYLVGSVSVKWECKSISIIGNYAYVGTTVTLVIYDVSTPASPVELPYTNSELSTGYIYSIYVVGTLAYAAHGVKGLVVLDVTNPAEPTISSVSKFLRGGVTDVAVHDGVIYVSAEGGRNLVSLDAKTLTGVVWRSGSGKGLGVAVRDNRVLLADMGLHSYTTSLQELGCFKTEVRFLDHVYTSDDNTPIKCAERCVAEGAVLAGVEYGKQCWCGKSFTAAVKTVGVECEAKPCTGDSSDHCGGSYRVRLYSLEVAKLPPAPTYYGCYSTSGTRPFQALGYVSSANTVEECASVCVYNRFNFAGLEYGDECWCGNSIPPLRVGSNACSLECPGDASQKCGAGWRMSVYSTRGSAAPIPRHADGGCFVDDASRVLPVHAFTDPEGCTVDECVAVCSHNKYRYSGLQDARECWCGNDVPPTAAPEGECNRPCTGDSSQTCGGYWRISLREHF